MNVLKYLQNTAKPKDRQDARIWALHLYRYWDETPDEKVIEKAIDEYFAGAKVAKPVAAASKPRPSK